MCIHLYIESMVYAMYKCIYMKDGILFSHKDRNSIIFYNMGKPEDIIVSEEISYRGTHNIWFHLYEVPKIAQHRET